MRVVGVLWGLSKSISPRSTFTSLSYNLTTLGVGGVLAIYGSRRAYSLLWGIVLLVIGLVVGGWGGLLVLVGAIIALVASHV